jgi:hypothetical protein
MLCPSVSVCSIFIGDKFEIEDTVSWLFIIPIYNSYNVYPVNVQLENNCSRDLTGRLWSWPSNFAKLSVVCLNRFAHHVNAIKRIVILLTE